MLIPSFFFLSFFFIRPQNTKAAIEVIALFMHLIRFIAYIRDLGWLPNYVFKTYSYLFCLISGSCGNFVKCRQLFVQNMNPWIAYSDSFADKFFFSHLPFCRSPCTIHPGINSIPQLEWICNVDITWLCSPSGNFPLNAGPIASPFGNYVLYGLRTGTLQILISSPNQQEHKRYWKHLTSISVFVYIHPSVSCHVNSVYRCVL